jgi:hypothetical protein
MIVFHAKPARSSFAWHCENIVGRINIDPVAKHPCCGISRELVPD